MSFFPSFLIVAIAALLSLSSGKQVGPGLTDYPFQGESITRLDGQWDLASENGHSLKANVSRKRERKEKRVVFVCFLSQSVFLPPLYLSSITIATSRWHTSMKRSSLMFLVFG
jgi:hypothetical protein